MFKYLPQLYRLSWPANPYQNDLQSLKSPFTIVIGQTAIWTRKVIYHLLPVSLHPPKQMCGILNCICFKINKNMRATKVHYKTSKFSFLSRVISFEYLIKSIKHLPGEQNYTLRTWTKVTRPIVIIYHRQPAQQL